MAWPPDVSDGQIITAAHINAIRTSVSVWGGGVDGSGYTLTNVTDISVIDRISIGNTAGDVNNTFRLDGYLNSLYIAGGSAAGAVAGTSMVFRTAAAGGGDGTDKLTIGPAGLVTIGGQWNSGHLVMGAYHLWVDGTGKLRIKSSAPVSDTDGVTVGSQ